MHDRVLLGRYRLNVQLGQGGMGSVWRAHDLTLHNQVAIKLIDPSIAESPEILERFKREALAAAELRSTHIVQVIDYGIDAGTPFIAMELLEGESLADRLDRVRQMTLEDTAAVLSQVARALARAHEKGIVHRDLKPDNIFIVREGDDEVVKVLDFGIAKKLDALSVGSNTKTRTGALLGTPYYMSPEQALGRTSIDHRTDIWSMGVIAYECLTGLRPFDSESVGALLMSICHEPIPTPSSMAAVNPAFDAWFARAAARDPGSRFQSAVEAAAALRSIGTAQAAASLPSVTNPSLVVTTGHQHDPTGLLETISTTSLTIPGKNRRKPPTNQRLWVGGGLGLTAVLALVIWHAFRTSVPLPAAVTAPVAPTGAHATLLAATAPKAAVAPKPPPTNTEAPRSPPSAGPTALQRPSNNGNPPAKPARRTATPHYDNPAGF